MTNDPSNRREFTRVPVHFDLRVTAAGKPVPCTAVRTLSMNGMFAQSTAELPAGTECEVRISLAEGEIEIELLASVVRNYPDGIAFSFTKILGPESYVHLRNLVLYNAPDTDSVEDEFAAHAGIRPKGPDVS